MQRMQSLGLYSLYVFEQHCPECNINFLLVSVCVVVAMVGGVGHTHK